MFDSLNYKSVLARGFALVRDGEGRVLRSAQGVLDGQPLVLEFVDGTAEAQVGAVESRKRRRSRSLPRPNKAPCSDRLRAMLPRWEEAVSPQTL